MDEKEIEFVNRKLGKFLTINRIDDNVREEFINFANEYFCGDFGMTLMHIWREFKMYSLWKEDVSIKLNYVIDFLLGLSFFVVAVTGVIKMPLVSRVLGLNYSFLNSIGFNFVHDWSGIVMIFLVVVHLVLHWNWIVSMTRVILRGE